MSDLFGMMNMPAMTDAERKRKQRRLAAKDRRGYAAQVGSGPAGETCGSCKHIERYRRFRKCALMRAAWTHGARTDILAKAPACSKWEATE